MPKQQGAHNEAFKDFLQSYPRDVVYPIFGLLECIAWSFPVLEPKEAMKAFVWVVGKHQTETVAKEQEAIATRNRSPERLQTPVLRALRQTRDYYFEDVRQNPNDDVAQRIPRWGKEVQTLPVYSGKIDTPHPVTLAWEYDSLKNVCELIKKEEGFSGWTKFARQIGDRQSDEIPFPLWSKDDPPITIDMPEDATAAEAAFAFLNKRTKLSVERLKKLVYHGNCFFPAEVSTMLRKRCRAVYADKDRLQRLFDSIEDKKEIAYEIEGGDDEIESFGSQPNSGFEIRYVLPFDELGLTLEQCDAFSKLLKAKNKK